MEIRWLNEYSKQFLEQDYLLPGQTVENRLQVIGDTAEKYLKQMCKNPEDTIKFDGYSQKLQSYIAKGWISMSTPIWTNFGTSRGLPISCFNSHFSDSVSSILETNCEIGIMTKTGGGTSGYFGEIRGRGSVITGNGSSNGTYPFLEYTQSTTSIISQGSTRRGYFAGYQDIFHPDIEEWCKIRSEGDPIQQVTWGVCVPTWWITSMREGDVPKRKLWAKIIQKRFETGLPYLFFNDNANNGESVPEVYKGKGLIKSSNLCNEIYLPSDINNSFVCDLGSMVDFYYDEWKHTDCVEVLVQLLDAAMEEFIEKASKVKFLEKAVFFAKNHRALGIGRLGYHTLLKSKMLSFESLEARYLNIDIQKTIKEQAYEASKNLAIILGKPSVCLNTDRRHTTLIAIAPTTSSAFIMQIHGMPASQSIEPTLSNFYIKDLAKGKFIIKDFFLMKLLESKGKNTSDIWDSIMKQQGSVLHLDCLTDEEKSIFKTAREISQKEILLQASQRQKYIDQGQSINLFVTADTTPKEVNELLLYAHDNGIKGLYYQHNVSAASEFAKNFNNCVNCE